LQCDTYPLNFLAGWFDYLSFQLSNSLTNTQIEYDILSIMQNIPPNKSDSDIKGKMEPAFWSKAKKRIQKTFHQQSLWFSMTLFFYGKILKKF